MPLLFAGATFFLLLPVFGGELGLRETHFQNCRRSFQDYCIHKSLIQLFLLLYLSLKKCYHTRREKKLTSFDRLSALL